MVFELKREPSNSISNPIVKSLKQKLNLPEPVNVDKVVFDGNSVNMGINLSNRKAQHYGDKPKSIEMTVPVMNGVPLNVTAVSPREDGIDFNFLFSPEYELTFVTQDHNFHNYIDRILTPVGIDANRRFAESIGDKPVEIGLELKYQMPLGVWHGLPPEIFSSLRKFRIGSGDYSVSWPSEEFLSPRSSHLFVHIPHNGVDIGDYIVSRGIVHKEVRNERGDNVRLEFKGEVKLDDFNNIPNEYDHFFHNGKVEVGNFSISREYNSARPIQVQVKGDLETAARVASILPDYPYFSRVEAIEKKSFYKKSVSLYELAQKK
ncbi:hypothetical protein COU57_01605 [Candidatus Pacearchaeota archaeon CG10_big_fil_rev_8_21_14_0_10_32_14]|nr:MAG: hypothetical protein COU57_01605 [Candidatus Pacearchaeota archaeon CG10_big_fil_rev_8_21_14_0_10_32_14]